MKLSIKQYFIEIVFTENPVIQGPSTGTDKNSITKVI